MFFFLLFVKKFYILPFILVTDRAVTPPAIPSAFQKSLISIRRRAQKIPAESCSALAHQSKGLPRSNSGATSLYRPPKPLPLPYPTPPPKKKKLPQEKILQQKDATGKDIT